MMRKQSIAATFAALVLGFGISGPARAGSKLTVGYSDWPGYLIWQIAIDKGWFKDAGVDVSFQWFDYSAGMDAFSAASSMPRTSRTATRW